MQIVSPPTAARTAAVTDSVRERIEDVYRREGRKAHGSIEVRPVRTLDVPELRDTDD